MMSVEERLSLDLCDVPEREITTYTNRKLSHANIKLEGHDSFSSFIYTKDLG